MGCKDLKIKQKQKLSGPFNLSGEWSGVMGDVITGKYPFSLSTWLSTSPRDDVGDFSVIVDYDKYVAYLSLKPPKIDPGLFIRPFTNATWLVILAMFLTQFILFILPPILMKNRSEKKTEAAITLVAWFFFVVVHAYYGGALTSFFTAETKLPFETIEDVLTEVPDWRVLFLKGAEESFKGKALQVILKVLHRRMAK